ncbi:MAG: YebC/PmpR family DNA-binding transcriptional regulator [Dehalococcoidia bacterium]|jgi:YebC/PmpR family DNA-binding regulatory protein|nr:YebC/PmpR family DNA-binding transcriptional regulator [Dehalococcoidia bacterium]MDP7239970.1 YebC/PmpR family DNA-binding transcriptional regulator [Dehalococcoidia bacterium]
MSGHSKWSKIKRQKGVTDVRRGLLFTKLGREITIAARQGGGNPETNFTLRLAIQSAKDGNMPAENIERAIKRALGGGEAGNLMEMTLEGYGPGGVAIIVEAITDNRNRTLQEIRNLFSRGGGNMGESGSVSWQFGLHGVMTLDVADPKNREEVALLAIDSGAEDVKIEQAFLEIYTKPQDLEAVRKALESHSIEIASAELSMQPNVMVNLEDKHAAATLRLLDHFEEMAEVQRVYSNADFSEEVLEAYRQDL